MLGTAAMPYWASHTQNFNVSWLAIKSKAKMQMDGPEPLHPANAEETGTEVLRGPLHYPGYSGGWQQHGCLQR